MKQAERMKKTFSENLKRLLDKKGLTQTDMARYLNIPETTVSNWIKASTYPRPDKIQLMADYFNVRRSDLTEEQPTNIYTLAPETVKIPILGAIACGDPILAEENLLGYRFESPDNLPSGTLYYLEAKGDSMEPTIPNGSLVMIRKQSDVEYGEIAAVQLNGDTEATLKRVKKQGDVVLLMPDNPAHEPYIITKDNPARIIGKAVRFVQDL
ncbi:XRE family transcriptional regulator [Paenibacillus larvae]